MIKVFLSSKKVWMKSIDTGKGLKQTNNCVSRELFTKFCFEKDKHLIPETNYANNEKSLLSKTMIFLSEIIKKLHVF